MQNWQRSLNYRRYKNADDTFRYVITVDGTEVEVSEEVYKAYTHEDRRERYQKERDAGKLLSIDRMEDDDVLLSYLTNNHAEAAEDSAIREIPIHQAIKAFSQLSHGERQLIQAVVIDGTTEKEYAESIGVRPSCGS